MQKGKGGCVVWPLFVCPGARSGKEIKGSLMG